MEITELLELNNCTENVCGVYAIINTSRMKIYIGSSNNIRYRLAKHFNELQKGKHHNQHLQHAYNKYGKDVFISKILETVENIDDLLRCEQKWIDRFDFEDDLYNCNPTAESCRGVKRKPFTEEHIRKLVESRRNGKGYICSDEQREKIRKSSLGRKHNDEAKQKISQTHKGKKKSPEHIEKMKEIFKGRKRTPEAIRKSSQGHYKEIIMLDKTTGDEIQRFESVKAASEFLNVKEPSSISQVALGKRKSAYGYIWKYVDS